MLDKKALKMKYQKLVNEDKRLIGEALVKVNMGVALPRDMKIVAGFLKGSAYISKAGVLDDLIDYLHHDEGFPPKVEKIEVPPPYEGGISTLTDSDIHSLKSFDEDSEITSKEKIFPDSKKKR